jgi:hypothetical protein
MADVFNETVRGRYPLSKHISSAATWAPRDGEGAYVPRPDKTLGFLRILACFGLDHLYLRSPITGVLKLGAMIALIGSLLAPGPYKLGALVAGLWYIWDIAQLWTEGDRVVTYGMNLPFDMRTGIGQGQITDTSTHYAQPKDFGMWSVFTLFGFTGIDALMGKPALFIRKLVDFLMFLAFGSGFLACLNAPSTGTIIGAIFLAVPLAIYGAFVGIPWWAAVSATIVNPARMFNQGIKVDEPTQQFLNYFNGWTPGIGKFTQKRVSREFGYGAVEPEELQSEFAIRFMSDEKKPKHQKEKEQGKDDAQKPIEPSTWMLSLLLGNVVSGSVLSAILSLPMLSVKAAKLALEMSMMTAEAAHKANEEHPSNHAAATAAFQGLVAKGTLEVGAEQLKGALGPLSGPLAGVVDQAVHVQGGLQTVLQGAQGALQHTVQGAVQNVVQGAQGALQGGLQTAVQGAQGALQQTVQGTVQNAVQGAQGALQHTVQGAVQNAVQGAIQGHQTGAGRNDTTTEGAILGAVTAAIIVGGALKAFIDSVVHD